MNIKRKLRSARAYLVALTLLIPALSIVLTQTASAASLTSGMVRFDRMNASQATTGTVCATPNATVQTEAAVAVTFPTGYTLGAYTTWSVGTTTTGWPSGAAAWPGITAPSAANQLSGQTVQFTSTDLTVSTLYCFNWTNSAAMAIKSSATNPNTGVITTCSASANCAGTGTGGGTGANLDTISWATSSVAATCTGVGCDQILVSATVTPSFSFALSTNAAALGTLSAGGPSAATAVNATVSTNASHGWQIWGADLGGGSAGLHSPTASKTIAYSPAAGGAVATLSTGVEGYNLGAGTASGTTCTGVVTDTLFASGGTSYRGGGLDGTLRSLAAATGVANACALPLTVNASISAITPAATDYAGTMTIVAAGSF